MIINSRNQWFLDDGYKKKIIPDLGDIKSIQCFDNKNSTSAAVLIIGNKNQILVNAFIDTDPSEKIDTARYTGEITDNTDSDTVSCIKAQTPEQNERLPAICENTIIKATDRTENDHFFNDIPETDDFIKIDDIKEFQNDRSWELDLHDDKPLSCEDSSGTINSDNTHDNKLQIIKGADKILQFSLFNGYSPFIKYLLENKLIDPEKNIYNHGSLLHTATCLFYPEIIETILEKQYVDINKLNDYQETAIIKACQYKDDQLETITDDALNKLFELLLSYHPDLTLKDSKQKTALEIAIRARYPLSIIKRLLNAGADICRLKQDLFSEFNKNPAGDEYFTSIKGLLGWLKGAGI